MISRSFWSNANPTKRELILPFKAIQNPNLTQVWCVIEKCCLITQYICLSNAKKLKILIVFFLFYFVLFCFILTCESVSSHLFQVPVPSNVCYSRIERSRGLSVVSKSTGKKQQNKTNQTKPNQTNNNQKKLKRFVCRYKLEGVRGNY